MPDEPSTPPPSSQDGDSAEAMLLRELDWLRARISPRLGGAARNLADTDDLIQDALLKVLHHGPRFVASDRAQLRALLARLVQNLLTDRFRYSTAEKRSVERAVPFQSADAVDPDLAATRARGPGSEVDLNERRNWVRLALELLTRSDREVIVLRQIDGRPFAEVSDMLGISEDAARMRFNRALPKLAQKVMLIRTGRLQDALEDVEA